MPFYILLLYLRMSGFCFLGVFVQEDRDITNANPDKKSSQKLLQAYRSVLCKETFQVEV